MQAPIMIVIKVLQMVAPFTLVRFDRTRIGSSIRLSAVSYKFLKISFVKFHQDLIKLKTVIDLEFLILICRRKCQDFFLFYFLLMKIVFLNQLHKIKQLIIKTINIYF